MSKVIVFDPTTAIVVVELHDHLPKWIVPASVVVKVYCGVVSVEGVAIGVISVITGAVVSAEGVKTVALYELRAPETVVHVITASFSLHVTSALASISGERVLTMSAAVWLAVTV